MHRSQTVAFTVALLWGIGVVTSLYLDGWEWAMLEVKHAVEVFGMTQNLTTLPLEYRSGLVVASALLMGWVGMSRSWPYFTYRFLFLAAGTFMLATFAFSLASAGWLMETASAMTAAVGSFTLAAWFSPTGSRRYQTLVRSGLSSGISRQRLDQVLDSKDLNLAPQQREITVLTLRLCDGLAVESACGSVESWIGLLNYLKREWHDFFRQHGGMILIEDGISVTTAFGVPLPSLRHSRKACRVGLALNDDIEAILAKVDEGVRDKLFFRLGIATGPAVVGILPQPGEIWDRYSVIGNIIEESRTLASIDGEGRLKIIISDRTHVAVKDAMECRTIDGKAHFELLRGT